MGNKAHTRATRTIDHVSKERKYHMKSNSDSMPIESYNVNSFAQCDCQTFITA